MNYPRLDVFTVPIDEQYELTEEEKRVEGALLSILIDMFERAYLMYHDEKQCIHSAQWAGWEATIRSYCY